MADYKNYFNNQNPLNLYAGSIGNLPFTSYILRQDGTVADKALSTPKTPYETDEDYALRLQQEELEYQDYIKRLEEYNQKIEALKQEAYMQRLLHPDFNNPNIDLLLQAENDVAYAIDPTTGKFKNPALLLHNQWKDFSKKYEGQLEYQKDYEEVNTLSKALFNLNEGKNNKDNEFISNLTSITKEDLKNRGIVDDDAEFDSAWDYMEESDRLAAITGALGRKYFKGETLEEFTDADDLERFDMLASYIRNNPYYESLASKHKKEIDWGDNAFSKDWKTATDRVTTRFLHGITTGDLYETVAGGLLSAAGNLGELAGDIVGSAGEYAQSRIEGMGFEEDVDDYIAERANAYIDKKAEIVYNDIQAKKSRKEKEDMVKKFEALSSDASDWYKAEKGTYLTKLTDKEGKDEEEAEFNSKLKLYVKLGVTMELYGEGAALKNLREFWENTIADNQTTTDKVLNTGGLFVNTAVADAAAFTGVMLNVVNPYTYTEGYSDALVQSNFLLDWATNLQETGAWFTEDLAKYKELGINANLIYKSVSDLNAFLSLNDFYDIVGQYGFTAATTALSMGGSAAAKSFATGLAKQSLKNTKRGAAIRFLSSAETRQALKAGLAEGATAAELTAAKEAAAKIAANAMYKGNLTVGAMMGTAEGALEAKSTYETFKEEALKGKDGGYGIEQLFNDRQQMLDNATDADLKDYMLNKGYTPTSIVKNSEGKGIAEFSPEQYQQARLELQKELDSAKKAAYDRIEDDAADAAFVNFMSNSLINGWLNVFAKEAIMSRDVREASRIAQGKNKLKDLVDVVKKGDVWEAIVKKSVKDNNIKNLWKKTKDIAGKTLKTASGEFREEYTQGLSDLVAREALQYDLNQYMNTVFDKDAREAFLTDWNGMLNTGLNSIMTNATNQENLKAGVFGALSSMMGGFSPAGLVPTVLGFALGRTDEDKGFWGTTKWVANNLSNLYQWGIGEAYRDSREETESAQRLVEATNAWLNTEKNLELLTHMGGAAGFKKMIEDAILSGDEFNAHDGKLGLAVENAFMLLALKDTDYGKAMQEKINQNAELLLVILDNNNFDAQGNYIGNLVSKEDGSVSAEEDWISKAINTYKSLLGDATKNTSLTDRQIAERIGKNASEFIQLQSDVIRAQQRVKNIFLNENLDPLAELAFVYALMSQLNTRDRKDELAEKLYNSTHNSNLSDRDKAALRLSTLDNDAIDFLIEHGTLEKAQKKYDSLREQSNKANEDAHNKKLSSELRKKARERGKYLELLQIILGRQLDNEITRRKHDTIIEESKDENENPISLVLQEAEILFSVGDMANRMTNQQRAEVIANKEKFSKEQQAIIDEFLTISRNNLKSENDDIALSNEEVAKDYIDLAALERRADTYDRYLTEYINNPSFLSTTAATYRQKERTRTLRHLYKEDLKMRTGESVLNYKERLDSKVQSLREQGKNEDANILNKLIYENKEVSKLSTNILEAEIATAIYRALQEVKDDDANLLDAAVKTLISNSGMSLLEIKSTLDKLDTASIVQNLTTKTSDGQISLNKNLRTRGLLTLDLNDDEAHNETVLAPIILNIKTFVDFYSNIKNDKSATLIESTPQVDSSTAGKPAAKAPSQAPKVPNTGLQDKAKQGREDLQLIITTSGALDQTSQLAGFLNERGANDAVRTLDNTKTPIIRLAVLKDWKDPIPFVVVKIQNDKHIEGKTIKIDGETYLVIGVVNHPNSGTYSDNIAELSKKAFGEIGSNNGGKLLANDKGYIQLEFSSIKNPKSMSELHLPEHKPLNTIYTTDDEINKYVIRTLQRGHLDDKNESENTMFSDGNNHIVLLSSDYSGQNGIEDFPIGNTTLQEILQKVDFSKNDSITNAINLLKSNEFFRAYFNAWTDTKLNTLYGGTNTTTLTAKLQLYVYLWLLGDYIYLGRTYPKDEDDANKKDSRDDHVNPRVTADGTITIDGIDKSDTDPNKWVAFKFKMPSGNFAQREQLALKVLYDLLSKDAGGNELAATKFRYAYPLIANKNIINRVYRDADAVERLKLRLIGLIKAGVIEGYEESAVNRLMQVRNPFSTGKKESSTRSNGKNASDFDPAPKGKGKGGLVNPLEGKGVGGNPKTHEESISSNLNEAQLKALSIVDRLIEKSNSVTLATSNSKTYLKEGVEYSRVTSIKHAYIGGKAKKFNADTNTTKISHAFGNTTDAVDRAAIEILNDALKTKEELDAVKLRERILKDSKFKGKTGIPNWSDYQIEEYLNQIILFHKVMTSKGWVLIPKEIRVPGSIPVMLNGVLIGSMPVAGTLDLLAYDKEGVFHIIDFKSIHMNSETDTLESNRDGWEVQTSSYQHLLEQEEEDMLFGLNYIMPSYIPYNSPTSEVTVADDEMTVTSHSPNGEPELMAKKTKSEYNIEDFLYPVNTLELKGYDFDSLDEEDLKRVIFNGADNGHTMPKSKDSSKPKPKEELGAKPKGKSIKSMMDDVPWDESRRTTRQAKYTEFINNHIAPVNKVKIGIVSRAVSKIKSLLNLDGKLVILLKELANIFFNGDVNKLELVLKGQKVTETNLPSIILALKNYYTSYVENADKYAANITRRYQLSKIVCEYLKGNISLDTLELELTKHNAKISSINELLEYMASPNKEEAAKRIIDKIETSKVNTKENYNESLQALNSTIESMLAKLDFLNSSTAERMLRERVTSVHLAIINNSYEETSYRKGGTIEGMLSSKSGSYGAIKLLRDIQLKTKNSNFKRLAGILLRLIKDKGITVPITIEDGSLNFVEGSTKGRAITIQKTSLDSYEHLERVLLHEMLHAVVEVSPEMKEILQNLLDLTINTLQKTTGKSIKELKEEYYGLSNVNEFISEFFTNYAFLETLKTIESNDYSSIFDKFISSLKERFTGDKSLYSQISEAMESILNSTNVEDTYRRTEKLEEYTGKTKLSELSVDMLLMILSRGFTKEEFDGMSFIEQEHIINCCK